MYTILLSLHVVIAILLVITVLLQSGKGGGLGAGFGGGGANTLFGSSGGSNFFTKLTMSLAAGFMITSLGLTMIKSKDIKSSIFDQGAAPAPVSAPADPAATPPAAAPAGDKAAEKPADKK